MPSALAVDNNETPITAGATPSTLCSGWFALPAWSSTALTAVLPLFSMAPPGGSFSPFASTPAPSPSSSPAATA